ncbi:MAG: hypothetical protein H6719_22120 [Sandaracinaceae bacterium]|nr:hypothetical protein [Sandaracinaceae bacterium]
MRALALAALLAGCSVPGTCDEAAATAVVSTREGIPAYEGQALMIRSCGARSFCHSEGVEAEARHGAPLGLDFDLGLASLGPEAGDVERLDVHQRRVFGLRTNIWQQVSSGMMPPGEEGRLARSAAPVYERTIPGSTSGDPLPEVDTDEGLEILRNWLRCGTPVIERTQPRADGQANLIGATVTRTCATSDECVFATAGRCDPDMRVCGPCVANDDCGHLGATPICQVTRGECVECAVDADCATTSDRTACDAAQGVCVPPVEPRWSAIHAQVMTPRCATPLCHDDRASGHLDLRDVAAGHAALVGVRSDGSILCRTTSLERVAPGDPDASLLVQKLQGEDASGAHVCGERMPLGRGEIPAQHLAAIREWIQAGAAQD